ncbi:MAG: DUF3616 domain-containing protein [Ketobacteraceae bacterium]|nr:DUF3616 domain-containing protein [Ketobacteraceae bacterium]
MRSAKIIRASKVLILLTALFSVSFKVSGKEIKPVSSEQFVLKVEGVSDMGPQNISGGASNIGIGKAVLVDDGGASPANDIYFWDGSASNILRSANFSLPTKHTDIEAATWSGTHPYIATSMTNRDPADSSGNLLTLINYSTSCQCALSVSSRNFRPIILDAFKKVFEKKWYLRVSTAASKKGGINVEGLSYVYGRKDALMVGFRSPLSSENFGDPELDPEYSYYNGNAIVLEVADPMGSRPEVRVHELDLQGQGVRSMEYSILADGYFIVSGPANVGNDYALWFWDMQRNDLQRMSVDGFSDLCRPETVFEWIDNDVAYLYVLSERAGKFCKDMTFDALRVRLDELK